MSTLLVYGAGRLGTQVARLVMGSAPHRVAGFIDDTLAIGTPVLDDLVVLGSLSDLADDCCGPEPSILFAIGYSDLTARRRAFERAKALGISILTYVHPQAWVADDAIVGEGSIVLPGARVDVGSRIGRANFLDLNVVLSEDCRIGDGNFLAAGTVLGGRARIGHASFVGLNCTVVDEVSIGSECTVNAGTLVHRDVADGDRLVELPVQRTLEGVGHGS